MGSWIFKKRGTAGKGRDLRPAASSSVRKIQAPDEATTQIDIVADEALLALHSRLSELSHISVAQAAKERGWAKMQQELERRPVRRVAPAPGRGLAAKPVLGGDGVRTAATGRSRGWRVAMGSLAAAAAILIGVLSSYGAGLFNTATETTVPMVVSTQGTTPSSVAVGDTTSSTSGPTTSNTQSTTPTDNTTTVTSGTSTTGGTQGNTTTSGGSSGTNGTSTTGTVQTSTGNTQVAAGQGERTAEALAEDLGRAVCAPDLPSISRQVATGAQASLTQLVKSLNAPTGFRVVSTKALSGSTFRVTLEFNDTNDHTTDTNGQPLVIHPRYNITIEVDDDSATIIGISRGS